MTRTSISHTPQHSPPTYTFVNSTTLPSKRYHANHPTYTSQTSNNDIYANTSPLYSMRFQYVTHSHGIQLTLKPCTSPPFTQTSRYCSRRILKHNMQRTGCSHNAQHVHTLNAMWPFSCWYAPLMKPKTRQRQSVPHIDLHQAATSSSTPKRQTQIYNLNCFHQDPQLHPVTSHLNPPYAPPKCPSITFGLSISISITHLS